MLNKCRHEDTMEEIEGYVCDTLDLKCDECGEKVSIYDWFKLLNEESERVIIRKIWRYLNNTLDLDGDPEWSEKFKKHFKIGIKCKKVKN